MPEEGEGLTWDLRAMAGNSEIAPQLRELARGMADFRRELHGQGFTREEAMELVGLGLLTGLDRAVLAQGREQHKG